MMVIHVNGTRVCIENYQPFVQGTVGLQANVQLSEEWDGLTVTAVFATADNFDTRYPVSTGSGTITVPWEVLSEARAHPLLSFDGRDSGGNLIRRSSICDLGEVAPSMDPLGETPTPAPPYPDWYENVFEAGQQAVQSAQDAEAYAKGTRGGTEVGTTDPAYHNNSKYFKEQAEAVRDSIPADYTELAGDVSELKSAVIKQYDINVWDSGSVGALDGHITVTANRWYNTLMLNSDIALYIASENPNVEFCVAGWENGVFQGILHTDNTFAKNWNDSLWTTKFDFTKYPRYNFTFVARSTDNTFNNDVKIYTTSDKLEFAHYIGSKCDTFAQGGYNGNAGDTISLNNSQVRRHVLLKDLSYIEKITFADGFNAFPKIVDANNVMQYQISGNGQDAYIPKLYRNSSYGLALTVYKTGDASITNAEASAATKIHFTKEYYDSYKMYSYSGEKIGLNKHNFNVYNGISIQNISGKHKQGCAAYGDVLVQLYSDDYAQLINIDTGSIIHSFTTTTGHGASAQFSTEFYSASDKYPLLYVSPEMKSDLSDSNEVQVIRVTDESWEIVRIIRVPNRSFAAIDNDMKKLVAVKIEKEITGWPKTLYIYDMNQPPTITDNVYEYPLVNTIPIGTYGVQQMCCLHQGNLFFLNSASDGNPHGTWIVVLDPYSGTVKNIIKDFPLGLSGTTSTSEVEGITIYYDKKFEKNMMFLVPSSTQTNKLDFDVY